MNYIRTRIFRIQYSYSRKHKEKEKERLFEQEYRILRVNSASLRQSESNVGGRRRAPGLAR